jgi:3-vinyl bacteriochlorophyllide hydratase
MALKKDPSISHHFDTELSINHYNACTSLLTAAPLISTDACSGVRASGQAIPLYTAEERLRRDASPWTVVQAVLAPIQFVIFLVSLALVLRYLVWSTGLVLATASVVIKTIALYAIMITGSIWEREVFGRYLFARPFLWEDVFSLLVLALHTLYLVALASNALTSHRLMLVALAAYAAYAVNATQFVLKLRAARRQPRATAFGALGLAP